MGVWRDEPSLIAPGAGTRQPAGRRKAEELRAQEEAFADDVLKRLPAEQRRPLLEGLQELLGAVRGARARMRVGHEQ